MSHDRYFLDRVIKRAIEISDGKAEFYSGNYSFYAAERLRLAQAGNVPAYIVFSNAVLEDMAARCPRTMDEFLEVSGVGAVKAQRYGENFLHVIEQYAQDTAEQPGMETS